MEEKEKRSFFLPGPANGFGVPFQQVLIDPNGSYTGVPENPEEEPVQDADDL